jgi:hypothetical protein
VPPATGVWPAASQPKHAPAPESGNRLARAWPAGATARTLKAVHAEPNFEEALVATTGMIDLLEGGRPHLVGAELGVAEGAQRRDCQERLAGRGCRATARSVSGSRPLRRSSVLRRRRPRRRYGSSVSAARPARPPGRAAERLMVPPRACAARSVARMRRHRHERSSVELTVRSRRRQPPHPRAVFRPGDGPARPCPP